MKNSAFRAVAIPTEVAETARCGAAHHAADHAIITVDSPTGFPCRHCLRWARPGERVVLFPYAAIPAGRPYSETGPIFVHAEPCQRFSSPAGFPPDFREGRVLRAYDSKQDMIGAEVVNGTDPEGVVEKMFQNPETAFVHARSVTHGCYTFRIERI